ncbi:MAG: hypothetical protein J5873_06590 [Bacteroidales bacterium]|nr:hypothetical protein [Bacteroidales bacterium]
MTKRLFRLLPLLPLLLCGCHSKDFCLTGSFEHCEADVLYLDELLPDGIVCRDTLLLVNGDFLHRFHQEETSIFRLRLSDTNFLSFIGGGEDRLTFQGDATDLKRSYRVSGNTSSQLLWEANRRVDAMYRLTDSLSRIFKRAQQSDSLSQLGPALDSCYQTHFLSCRAFLEELIENNLDDLAVLPVFYQRVGTRAFFSESADADLLRRIQSHLNRAYPGNTHILSLNERLEK